MTTLWTVLYVDGGMWRDPDLVGPFATAEDAHAFVARTWPTMVREDDGYQDGDDEILVLPVGKVR